MSEVIAQQVGCPPTNHNPFHAICENRVIWNHVNSHWEPRKRSPRPPAPFPAKRSRRPAHRSQSCHSEAERGGGICGTWHGRKGMPVSHSPSATSHLLFFQRATDPQEGLAAGAVLRCAADFELSASGPVLSVLDFAYAP